MNNHQDMLAVACTVISSSFTFHFHSPLWKLLPHPPSHCLPGCGGPTPHHLCGSTGNCSSSDCHQTEQVEGREGTHWPTSLLQPGRRRGGDWGWDLWWSEREEWPYSRTNAAIPRLETRHIGKKRVYNYGELIRTPMQSTKGKSRERVHASRL